MLCPRVYGRLFFPDFSWKQVIIIYKSLILNKNETNSRKKDFSSFLTAGIDTPNAPMGDMRSLLDRPPIL